MTARHMVRCGFTGGGVRHVLGNMGLTVNVEDSRMLREPIDRAREQGREEGREEGMAEMVARLLSIRFRGAMPPDVDLPEHLRGHKPEGLRDILDRAVTADSIEAALGTHMPASPLPAFKEAASKDRSETSPATTIELEAAHAERSRFGVTSNA
jgi:hypothetical protein